MTKSKFILAMLATLTLTGCANTHMAGSGPSAEQVTEPGSGIRVVDLTPAVAREAAAAVRHESLAEFEAPAATLLVLPGDQIEVSLWEAPPAVLFANLATNPGQAVSLPAQTVSADGEITVPFVGRVLAAGKTAKQIEVAILEGLRGKAHKPQAIVRVSKNSTSDVTVVGDVIASVRMPITPRGERLLDAIASAGGTKSPVDKATVQIARGDKHRSAPLESVIRDPAQNVRLMAGDVITVYHQPLSFTAMGAVQKPGEVSFEAVGLTLSQAMARVGGPLDGRADAEGVFLFRQGDDPIVYRMNMRDPAALLAMRAFPVQDKDIIYAANAPIAEFHKFMSVVAAVVYPVASVRNLVLD